jgi:hypothetical protein
MQLRCKKLCQDASLAACCCCCCSRSKGGYTMLALLSHAARGWLFCLGGGDDRQKILLFLGGNW